MDYRARFLEAFGSTNCGVLRRSGFGSGGSVPYSALVAQAARNLLDMLDSDSAETADPADPAEG